MKNRIIITILILTSLASANFYFGKTYHYLGGYSNDNILFDSDTATYIDVLARDKADWQSTPASTRSSIFWKHPMTYGYRVLTSPMTSLGLSAPLAAILLVSVFSASTACVLLWAAWLSGLDTVLSLMIVGLYSVSTVSFFGGGMPESYGLVALPVAGLWLCLVHAVSRPRVMPAWGRALVGAAATGTTLFFAPLYALIELLVLIRRKNGLPKYHDYFSWDVLAGPAYFAAFFSLGMIAVYLPYLASIFADPVASAKHLVWAAVTHGETVGPLAILRTFLVYPLFAPEMTLVHLPGEGVMADFRAFLYPQWVLPMIVLLIGAITYGIFEGLRDRSYRMVTIAALAWLSFCFVFHLEYQFRGSVYLYVPHHWFAVFLLIVSAVRGLSRKVSPVARPAALFCLLALILSASLLNSTRTGEFWKWLQIREATAHYSPALVPTSVIQHTAH